MKIAAFLLLAVMAVPAYADPLLLPKAYCMPGYTHPADRAFREEKRLYTGDPEGYFYKCSELVSLRGNVIYVTFSGRVKELSLRGAPAGEDISMTAVLKALSSWAGNQRASSARKPLETTVGPYVFGRRVTRAEDVDESVVISPTLGYIAGNITGDVTGRYTIVAERIRDSYFVVTLANYDEAISSTVSVDVAREVLKLNRKRFNAASAIGLAK